MAESAARRGLLAGSAPAFARAARPRRGAYIDTERLRGGPRAVVHGAGRVGRAAGRIHDRDRALVAPIERRGTVSR